MSKSSHLVTLMSRYYECVDRISELRDQAASLKQEILHEADPGRFGRYTIFRVKKTEIHVKAYTRRAYNGIRRGRG